jgi:Domain of unknown function (DUF5664)
MPTPKPLFGTDAAERKQCPIFTGVMNYFAAALAEVARVSYTGNEQHNPGQPLHWSRGKSTDQLDTALRHMMDHQNGPLDTDGRYHLAKAIWRLCAELQIHLEMSGAPLAPGAVLPTPTISQGPIDGGITSTSGGINGISVPYCLQAELESKSNG